VAGVVATALAGQLVISRPLGTTPPSWAMVLLGGPALFLLGRLLLGFTVFGQASWVQSVGLAGVVALAPATTVLPPIMVGLLVAVVLAFVALAGVVEARTRRPIPARR